MAKRNEKDFSENLNEIHSVVQKYVKGDLVDHALFVHEINKTIIKDDTGRAYLSQYAIAMRRKVVVKSFNGENAKQLADKFDVSERTIRNDIREYYNSQRKKSKVKGLLFITPQKASQ